MGDEGVTHLFLSGNADNYILFLFISPSSFGGKLISLIDKKTANLMVEEKESRKNPIATARLHFLVALETEMLGI